RALMAAYTRGLRVVDASVVRDAVHDIAGVAPVRRTGGLRPAWLAGGLVVAGVIGAAIAWWLAGGSGNPTPGVAPVAVAAVMASAKPVAALVQPAQSKRAPAVASAPTGAVTRTVAANAATSAGSIRRWLAALP